MGRGWSNAERTAENVTRRLIDEAVAPSVSPVVAVARRDRRGARRMSAGCSARLELETAPWASSEARILGAPAESGGPGYAAVLAFESPTPPASWLFDAGLARGALGTRAVVAQLGDSGDPGGARRRGRDSARSRMTRPRFVR